MHLKVFHILPMPRMSIEDTESLKALLSSEMHGELIITKAACAIVTTTL